MLSIKGFLESVVKNVFYAILFALVIAGIIYFFANVLFGKEYVFVSLLRSTYIWVFVISVALEVVVFFIRILYFSLIASRIKRPFADVEMAILKYHLGKKVGLSKITSEEFDQALSTAKAVEGLGEAIAKALANR